MALKSTADHYGTVAMIVHWLSAIAILGLLWAGFTAANTVDEAAKIQILRLHTSAGVDGVFGLSSTSMRQGL